MCVAEMTGVSQVTRLRVQMGAFAEEWLHVGTRGEELTGIPCRKPSSVCASLRLTRGLDRVYVEGDSCTCTVLMKVLGSYVPTGAPYAASPLRLSNQQSSLQSAEM